MLHTTLVMESGLIPCATLSDTEPTCSEHISGRSRLTQTICFLRGNAYHSTTGYQVLTINTKELNTHKGHARFQFPMYEHELTFCSLSQ